MKHIKHLVSVELVGCIALLFATLFLTATQLQVHTYICGNDPMLYIRAARACLNPALYGWDTVLARLTATAPGYPVLLAVVMGCFGDLAPYWVNFVLSLIWAPVVWLVLRELMGSSRAASFSLLGLLIIAFAGHDTNAAQLLYPFREMPRILLVYISYWLLIKGCRTEGRRWMWMLGSALAIMIAAAIREPTVLVVPWLFVAPVALVTGWRGRLRAMGLFALPFFVAGIALCLLMINRDLTQISQFSVLNYLRNHEVAFNRQRTMMRWFVDEVTWPGLLLVGIGVAKAIHRKRALLVMFFFPAASFFIFYSYMHMHHRYFLTNLLFLAVFAGYGLHVLALAVEKIFSKQSWAPALRPALTWVGIVLLAGSLYATATTRSVWGPEVDAGQVKEWQRLVAMLEADSDGRVRVAVEQRCRYLEDMILSYTDAELLDPKEMAGWPSAWQKVHYFRPLNRAARYATPQWLMWLKIYAHRIMADQGDLLHMPDTEVPRIGEGEYAHYVLSPRRAGVHSQSLDVPSGDGAVVWLDWGVCDPDEGRSVEVREEDGKGKMSFPEVSGAGLQALLLPATVSGQCQLAVSSLTAVAASPVLDVLPSGKSKSFLLGTDRVMSLNRLVSDVDEDDIEEYPLKLKMGRQLSFHVPPLYGGKSGEWRVVLSGRLESASDCTLLLTRPNAIKEARDVAVDEARCSFIAEPGAIIDLELLSAQHPGKGFWVIKKVEFQYKTRDLPGGQS